MIVLMGNKVDCATERVVATEEGRALAAQYGCPFFEGSAATGENVEAAFMKLATIAIDYIDGSASESEGESGLDMGSGDQSAPSSSGCQC